MKRLLCIWLPNWPVQRRRVAHRPAATDAPDNEPTNAETANAITILWHADPRRGRIVAACCDRAASMGIRLGMPIAQASDVAATLKAEGVNVLIDEHDRVADQRTLHSVAAELQHHVCPQIAIETLDRFKWAGRFRHDPESVVAEIQGVTHLFDDETGLLYAAATVLKQHGLRGRLAIAGTLGAAWALATHAPSRSFRTANELECFIAPTDRIRDAIQNLPPTALRLSPTDVDTLDRLGVSTIGALLQLPRDGLATRLGRPLCQRIAQALGEIDEPILAIDLPTEHAAELELEYPTDALDLLRDRIIRLIDAATKTLRPLGRGVLRLRCHVSFTEAPPVTLESGLFSPTLDLEHLSNLMIGAFESHSCQSKVTHLRLCVLQDAVLASTQPSIFGPGFQSDAQTDWTRQTDVARLIDSISGRLGEDSVRGVRINRDPLPEESVTDFAMTTKRGRAIATPKRKRRSRAVSKEESPGQDGAASRSFLAGAPTTNDAGRRPLQLHATPQPLIANFDGAVSDGAAFPATFRYRGHVWTVLRRWGPERIETRWWQGPMIRRDYFRVEVNDGARWWIFRDLTEPDQWKLHGQFD